MCVGHYYYAIHWLNHDFTIFNGSVFKMDVNLMDRAPVNFQIYINYIADNMIQKYNKKIKLKRMHLNVQYIVPSKSIIM